MEFVNCTPHEINVVLPDGTIRTIPTSGHITRCSQVNEIVAIIDGIPVTRQKLGSVVNLPDKKEGVFLIVSRIVAAAEPGRDDLLIPGPLVRDEKGIVKGCEGLSVL
ncbi:hypothetical protein [Mitsuokella sp.]|uniref:hypothetical protein n=1 Tax=Mitsuokella sp. TaxID=2049034 RepID=UPI002A8162F0|nr:hypothetical protein [Mitsuokella sp.]MDY4474591.1 hypothetical protein [Mitsuokella sp.]